MATVNPNYYEYLKQPPYKNEPPTSFNDAPLFIWGNSCDADEIIVGMWIGSDNAAGDYAFLKRKGIKTVINISDTNDAYLKNPTIEYSHYPFKANANYFESLIQFMCSALTKGSVLLHCEYGDQRSPIIMAALLMRTHAKTANDAVKLIQAFRPSALKPNIQYLETLVRYAKQYTRPAAARYIGVAPKK